MYLKFFQTSLFTGKKLSISGAIHLLNKNVWGNYNVVKSMTEV